MNLSRQISLLLIALTACPLLPVTAADAPAVVAPAPSNAPQFGTIQLFNDRNLDGLHVFLADPKSDPAKTWIVKDGMLHGTGIPYGYIRTQMAYSDYKLHVEWRWPNGAGNSGVVMHLVNRDEIWPKGFEVNMLAGQAGSFALFWDARSKEENVGRLSGRFSTGRLARRGPESVEKPLGEWNSFDITAAGDTIIVTLNGIEVNRMTGVSPSAGAIALQSEGAAIEFRNWTLTPLPPAKDLVTQVPPAK